MVELAELDLKNTPVKELGSLSNNKNLRNLNIQGTLVQNVDALAHAHQLEYAIIGDTIVNNVNAFSKLKNLRSLFADNTHITDFRPIQYLESLENLSFNNTPFSRRNNDLRYLSGLGFEECAKQLLVYMNNNNLSHLFPDENVLGDADKGSSTKSGLIENHINFLMSTPLATRMVSLGTSDQIGLSISQYLNESRVNTLPDELKIISDIRDTFRRLGVASYDSEAFSVLSAENKILTEQIEKLVDQVKNAGKTSKADIFLNAFLEKAGGSLGTGLIAGAGYIIGAYGTETIDALAEVLSSRQ
jgi:hypothetical protein